MDLLFIDRKKYMKSDKSCENLVKWKITIFSVALNMFYGYVL